MKEDKNDTLKIVREIMRLQQHWIERDTSWKDEKKKLQQNIKECKTQIKILEKGSITKKIQRHTRIKSDLHEYIEKKPCLIDYNNWDTVEEASISNDRESSHSKEECSSFSSPNKTIGKKEKINNDLNKKIKEYKLKNNLCSISEILDKGEKINQNDLMQNPNVVLSSHQKVMNFKEYNNSPDSRPFLRNPIPLSNDQPRKSKKNNRVNHQAMKNLSEYSERNFTKPSATTEGQEKYLIKDKDEFLINENQKEQLSLLYDLNKDIFENTECISWSPSDSSISLTSPLITQINNCKSSDFQQVLNQPLHLDAITNLSQIENGNKSLLVSASEDCTVKLWEENNTKLIRQITLYSEIESIQSLCVTNNKIVTGFANGKVSIFDINNHFKIEKISASNNPIWSLASNKSNNILVTSSDSLEVISIENKISLHNIRNINDKNRFGKTDFIENDLIVSSISNLYYLDNWFDIFDIKKEKITSNINSKGGFVNDFCVDKDSSTTIVSGTENKKIEVIDVRSLQVEHSLIAHTDSIVSLDFNSKSNLIVTAGLDSSLRLWDFRTLRCLQEISIHHPKYDQTVRVVKFEHDQKTVLIGCSDGSIRIFNI